MTTLTDRIEKDEIGFVDPQRSGCEPRFDMLLAVCSKNGDGVGVEIDRTGEAVHLPVHKGDSHVTYRKRTDRVIRVNIPLWH